MLRKLREVGDSRQPALRVPLFAGLAVGVVLKGFQVLRVMR